MVERQQHPLKPTTPHTPQENSKAERVNHTLASRTRSSLAHSNLPPILWEYALLDTVDKYNETYHYSTKTVPAAVWYNRDPEYQAFLQFGQFGFVADPKEHKTKSQDRSKLAQYLCRYDNHHYTVLFTKSNTVGKTRIKDFQVYSPYHDPDAHTTTITTNQHKLLQVTPKSLKQAQQSQEAEEWDKAYTAELEKFDEIKAIKWISKEEVPAGTKVLPLKMTYRIKHDQDGKVAKYKARCTVRGDKQIPNEHFDPNNIISPVADRDAIRSALSMAAAYNLEAEHLDIESAFLHEFIGPTDKIYVKQLPQFDGSYKHKDKVGLLQRSVYGIKQACRLFTSGVARNLKLLQFDRSNADACTFVLQDSTNKDFCILVITVDDFLAVANSKKIIETLKAQLRTKYKLHDLGPVQNIINWKVERDRKEGTLKISQPHYINQILSTYNAERIKPAPTPYLPDKLSKRKEEETELNQRIHPYQNLVGHLRYLADSTRPDLSHIVGLLGRYTKSPCIRHWKAALRTLAYIKGTSQFGITYGKPAPLEAYSDSDYASCPDTYRSTTGYIITWNQGPIAWQSKRQRRVAGSTWEAEYIAGYHATRHVAIMRRLLSDIKLPQAAPTKLFIDNSAAISTALTPHPTAKSKQLNEQYHFLKEMINDKIIRPEKIHTSNNIADCLTKPLPNSKFQKCLVMMKLQPMISGAATVI